MLLVATSAAAATGSIADQRQESWRDSFGEIGYFGGRADEGLEGSDEGIAIGGGLGWRHSRHLRFEFDALFSGRNYDVPPAYRAYNDQMTLSNLLFSGIVQGIFPFWLFEGYGGVGLGFMVSELEIPSAYVSFEGALTRSSFDVATQVIVGLDFVFTRKSRIGLEFRNVFATADFGDLSRGGVDVGGRLVTIKIKIPF